MFGVFLVALLIGLALALLFAYGLGRPGPWDGFLWVFLIVFLGAWAIGLWVEPVGPVVWGVAWVPIFFGALLLALLIAAVPPTTHTGPPAPEAEPERAETAAAVGLFFWVLLMGLFFVILLSFLF